MSSKVGLGLLTIALITTACETMRGQVEAYIDTQLSTAPAQAVSSDGCLPQQTVSESQSLTFEFHNSADMAMSGGGGIDFAAVDYIVLCPSVEQLRLVSFKAAPGGQSIDSPMLTPDETFKRFRNSFYETAVGKTQTINGLQVEIIKFAISDPAHSNGIIRLDSNVGIVALWRNKTTSYALFNLTNEHLKAQVLEKVLTAIKFKH